jgi:hypothetical protein
MAGYHHLCMLFRLALCPSFWDLVACSSGMTGVHALVAATAVGSEAVQLSPAALPWSALTLAECMQDEHFHTALRAEEGANACCVSIGWHVCLLE